MSNGNYWQYRIVKCQENCIFRTGKNSVTSVMATYDWATEMAKNEECVISSFKSKLETDVWHFLLRGKQPLIIVFARKKHSRLPLLYRKLIASERLLIIYLGKCDERNSKASDMRNKYIAEIADMIVFASINSESSLYHIYERYRNKSTVIDGSEL